MISVVVPVSRPDRVPYVLANFTRQELIAKHLVLVLNAGAEHAQVASSDNLTVLRCPGGYPARARNYGLAWLKEHRPEDAVAFLDDDDYYGRGYLSEVVQELSSGGRRRVVGKYAKYVRFDDGVYYCMRRQEALLGGTIAGWVDTLPLIPDIPLGEDREWCVQMRAAGYDVRVLSGLYYLYNRKTGEHAWRSSKVQALHVFGPSFFMGDVDDTVVDTPLPPGSVYTAAPTLMDVEMDLLTRMKARPVDEKLIALAVM